MNMSFSKFEIEKFSSKFREIIDWMRVGQHSQEIEGDLKLFMYNKKELQRHPDSAKALRTLVELIVTQAWYYRKPAEYDREIADFLKVHGANFRKDVAQKRLMNIVKKVTPAPIREEAQERVENLLKYETIEKFTRKLYESSQLGKENSILGEKGRDNYLRDFGYWDRIPMDRHEMRFIIRTGIYHSCSANNFSDPTDKKSLHDSLTRFCSDYLTQKKLKIQTQGELELVDLGNAPGIVDLFIWSYCGKGRYNICASSPKCDKCKLHNTCLYGLQPHCGTSLI